MMRSNTNPMKGLYSRLNQAGVKPSYVRDVILPSWWNDEIALNPAGFAEAVGYVCASLGIPPQRLYGSGDVDPPQHQVKFKVRQGVEREALAWPAEIALRAAAMAASVAKTPVADVTRGAAIVRHDLLSGRCRWIDLPTLLDYCWSKGIIVLHVPHLPQGKMDGMATSIDDRPVIVVSCNTSSLAQSLFILAHELGHIACGHLKGGAIIDGELKSAATEDADEKQANAYAIELLTGNAKLPILHKRHPTAVKTWATYAGGDRRIYPSVLAVLSAWHGSAGWPVAIKAARELEQGTEEAPDIFRKRMQSNLDLDALPDESREYLKRLSMA